MLAEAHRVDGQWAQVTLAYGQPDTGSGPLLLMTTFAPGHGGADDDPQTTLRNALEHEETRRAPAFRPVEPTSLSTFRILWDGAEICAPCARRGDLWALFAVSAGQQVIAVGRGVELQPLQLTQVDDLAPFLDGRKAMLRRLRDA